MRSVKALGLFFIFLFSFSIHFAYAQDVSSPAAEATDSDNDGLKDALELEIYHTDIYNPDTDNDGYLDGSEILYNFDPRVPAPNDKLAKTIHVDLKKQELSYGLGNYILNTIKVSTGVRRTPTPKGNFEILKKIPVHLYKGAGYYYPNTRWNMMFKPGSAGNLYIHGAYWHNRFGTPMSHGCVNVSYADIEPLYNWADVGTKVIIE